MTRGRASATLLCMGRKEYVDDPDAPTANSVVVAASAVVTDDHGAVLLQRRSDNNRWSVPGGAMELGESIAAAAVREVREETGLEVEVVSLIGVYSDPRHVVAYDDGEVRQQFSICFACRATGGSLGTSDESLDVRFFAWDELDGLDIAAPIALRLRHFREHRVEPVIA